MVNALGMLETGGTYPFCALFGAGKFEMMITLTS